MCRCAQPLTEQMVVLASALLCMLCGKEPQKEAYIQGSAKSIQQLPHLHHGDTVMHLDVYSFAL